MALNLVAAGAIGGARRFHARNVFKLEEAGSELELVGAAGQPFLLLPGQYRVDMDLRVQSGGLSAPSLIARDSFGRAQRFELQQRSVQHWHGEFMLGQTASALFFAPGCPSSFRIKQIRISDGRELSLWRRLMSAGILALRKIFHALPVSLREGVSRTPWLVRALARLSGAPQAGDVAEAGRVVALAADRGQGSDDAPVLDAWQADFEDRMARARGLKAADYVGPEQPLPRWAHPAPAQTVAFYLPQFHAIPENDAWWGEGFTEWTNVTRSNPQFVGHYQPRLPGELGFYHLDTPGVIASQVRLAKMFGVSAFCFYYYWFDGKRLLEKPLDRFLADGAIDFPFCVCWANENWTRRWDGADHAVLIAQRHSAADDAAVFEDLARYLADPRCIRIDGKPMLLIYRPNLLPDVRATLGRWRAAASALGWPGLFLVATNSFAFQDFASFGFDAVCEVPPHGLSPTRVDRQQTWLNRAHTGAVMDYAELAQREIARNQARESAPQCVFPGVMPGWDNEARKPGAGTVFHGASPDLYAAWLSSAAAAAQRTLAPDRRFVFINAWNEWAEGAYLEPDRLHGRAYLAATARALGGV